MQQRGRDSKGGQDRDTGPRGLLAFYRAFADRRSRPSCLIAALALLLLSLVYCGGLAAMFLLDRDPQTGALVPRFALQATPTATAAASPLPTPTPTP